MSLTDIAILVVIAAAVFFALRRIIRMRKSGCSCGCGKCDASCAAERRK